MSERKYITRTMTVALSVPEDVSDEKMGDWQAGLTAYAGSMLYVQGATVTIEEPPTEGPEITGQINAGGQVSAFRIPLEEGSVRYSQWGASNTVLWPRTDLVSAIAEAGWDWWYLERPTTDEDNEGEEA